MRKEDRIFLGKANKFFGTNYKATIKFDMDDVLALFANDWIGLYNELYDDKLTPEDLHDWDTTKFVKPECGLKIYDLFKHPGLFRNLAPNKDAQDVIQRLIDNGFEIIVVSDSPKGHSHCESENIEGLLANPADDKRAWLEEHFPMIPKENIIFCSQKHRVRGDVLIDDKPQTFEIHEALGMEAILIDRAYNRYIKTDKRAKSLLEAEQMVYKMFME